MRKVGAAYLKFLIDDMCAKFSLKSMSALVKTRLAQGPCSVEDIAQAVAASDRSLDILSARALGRAAVDALANSGDVVIRGDRVELAARDP